MQQSRASTSLACSTLRSTATIPYGDKMLGHSICSLASMHRLTLTLTRLPLQTVTRDTLSKPQRHIPVRPYTYTLLRVEIDKPVRSRRLSLHLIESYPIETDFQSLRNGSPCRANNETSPASTRETRGEESQQGNATQQCLAYPGNPFITSSSYCLPDALHSNSQPSVGIEPECG